jgi:hypothetical protein
MKTVITEDCNRMCVLKLSHRTANIYLIHIDAMIKITPWKSAGTTSGQPKESNCSAVPISSQKNKRTTYPAGKKCCGPVCSCMLYRKSH